MNISQFIHTALYVPLLYKYREKLSLLSLYKYIYIYNDPNLG